MRTMVSKRLVLIFLKVYVCNAAVFLCSNEKLEISPLQRFTAETYSNLIKQLRNPQVFLFKTSSELSPDIKKIIRFRGYFSAFVPNGEYDDINADNIDVLEGGESDVMKIEETLPYANSSENVLLMIFLPSKRFKREIRESGPVIYTGQNKNKLYALLYSSKPLLLKMNDSEAHEIHLGNTLPDMIVYDNRLNVNVKPLEGGGKVTLRFSFSWLNGYWSMPSVKVFHSTTNGDFNLTTDENIMAPAHFSYHCNGHTLFSDGNGVELYIYDLQVQTDSQNGKFGDANDCVGFTTAPIWSGLFVTTLLGIGLIIALMAIMDIKTMDKFDNHKTKNIAITISE